jgi:hypothetical protein
MEASFTAASAAIVAQNWSALQNLDVCGCRNVTDGWVTAFSQHCTGLREFHARSTALTDTSIRALAANCAGLWVVSVSGIDIISDDGITALSWNCAGLESLDVRWCPRVSDASIIAIAQHCRGLRKVYMGGGQ